MTFSFDADQLLTFFAVLIRISVMVAVAPWLGDRAIPAPVKVLLAVALTVMIYPVLIMNGWIDPRLAGRWSNQVFSLITVIGGELAVGLVFGFVARFSFFALEFGSSLVGTYMGMSSAAQFDPHQESQSQVVSQFQMALAMLLFLATEGHQLLIRGLMESYRTIGLGGVSLSDTGAATLITLSGKVVWIGVQISAPVALALFAINVVFALMSRAMPQLNVLSVSFAVTVLVGMVTLFLTTVDQQNYAQEVFGAMNQDLTKGLSVLAGR